jgi:P-type Ca2+ transporter type 2C
VELQKPAYQESSEKIAETLSVQTDLGLTKKEAQKRLERQGKNRLESKQNVSLLRIFFYQFKSLVMVLLMVAAIASFIIGESIEGLAILVVILMTATIGLVMEYKAGKSIEALQKTIKNTANVLRDKKVVALLTERIVSGDIVYLEEGDRVPADGRIHHVQGLTVDESMLTGESDVVLKTDQTIEEDTPLAKRKNMVYMGTHVVKGYAYFIVTATGRKTEVGRIATLLKESEDKDTPLEKRLEQTGRQLIALTLIITGIMAVVGYFLGNSLESMVKTSIALAIAAVPEGLPVAATITLAIGMKRMVKKNALLRSLPAVETLGSTTVLCTDKTGTLTENEMTLKKLVTIKRKIDIEGSGYEPKGAFKDHNKTIEPCDDPLISTMLKVGVLCNTAELKQDDQGRYTIVGDPTEGALIVAAKKAGLTRKELEESWTLVESVPFDPERKYMVVHYKSEKNESLVAVKGAPEVLLPMCEQYEESGRKPLRKKQKKVFEKLNTKLAQDRYRVLGLAYKTLDYDQNIDLNEVIEKGLVFLGLTGMLDPARSGIKGSIAEATKAGIRTIMLTGDQEETAIGIGKSVGLRVDEKALSHNRSVETLSKKELRDELGHRNIFARVLPEDKIRIVESLQENHEVVAMTGDGVNDAPALKKADIGIAMGKRGTSVAKEASDMILLDDRYQTIIEAVKQGRVIFDNILKFIHYLLTCNLSEIVFIFVAMIIGLPLPLVALQILWLNVATGVFPALSMAWEVPETNVMDRSPRAPDEPIITNRYKRIIAFQGTIIALGPLLSYHVAIHSGLPLSTARSIGFMALAMVHMFQVFNVRKRSGLGFDRSLKKNRYILAALSITFILQLLAIYFPPLQGLLQTESLSFTSWSYVWMGAIAPIVFLQSLAYVRHRNNRVREQ